MGEEPCETGGGPGFEIPGGLDGRELSEGPAHSVEVQWLQLSCIVVSRWI